jgi:succinoglycan biosynthesis transport protein ExoP
MGMSVASISGSGSDRPAENYLDLSMLGRDLWRKRAWILVPTLIAAIGAIIYVNIATPIYRSEARLLVVGKENVFLRLDGEKTTSVDRTDVDPEAVTSQAQILMSRDLALRVIKELNLGSLPEFDPVLRGVSLPGTILSLFGLGRDSLKLSPEDRVLASYYERLSVLPIDKSRVIQVEFQSRDPQLAARVANAIVDTYFTMQRAAKLEQTRDAGQWLLSEIEKLRPKVAEAEAAVENFRAKANLFAGPNSSNLQQQQLAELTSQLSAARANKAELEAKAKLISDLLKSGKPVDSAEIVNSDLLKRLVEQRITLRSQLAEQSTTLLERHPRIQELRAQINALDAQIRGELQRQVRAFETDARIAGARIETLTATIDRLKNQIAASSGQDVQLRALEREAKTQRDLLESYLAKYREASARDSLDAVPTDARVISRATVSNNPIFPKKIPIVLITTMASAFVATALVTAGSLLGEGSAPSTREPAPVRPSKLASRFNFFRRRKKPEAIPAETQPDEKPAAMDDLVRALRQLGEAGRRVTVVGAARNVGTTYTALGLARGLVAQGGRVVLVDLAFSAPNLAVISTNPEAPGVAELVRGTASFGQIVTRDKFSRLHLVATGKLAGEGGAILSSPRLVMALDALARTYDHVVIDAGAVPEMTVEPFARMAPRAVLVTTDLTHPSTIAARERLVAAGFTDVTLLLGTPHAATRSRPAAA